MKLGVEKVADFRGKKGRQLALTWKRKILFSETEGKEDRLSGWVYVIVGNGQEL